MPRPVTRHVPRRIHVDVPVTQLAKHIAENLEELHGRHVVVNLT